ncbi:hypothetical protein NOMA109596_06850 [Nocardioides marinus]|uniref:Uncharacterized protein n=1 Tax=Nocardioides marinus TaxID=374514 RepID=A0A7Z0C335_9ACTN|nr:hypothetical protein [Nocardioides marinus]NYI09862.1 hypothetical protein [Nocardioides marinus]
MTTAEVFPFPEGPGQKGNGNGCAPRRNRRPRSRYTKSEALRAGLCEDKAQYDRVEPVVDMTISHYHPTGLPQSEWYPRPIAATTLAKPFIQGGESILRLGLETEVDPALDEIAENNETIKNDLDQLARFPSDIATPEGNKRYGGHDAVEHVEDSTERIEDDRANGQRHHDRVPKALRLIAKWAPWAEAFGFFVFAAYFLNVPILQPWLDWMGWTFAVVLVVGICLILAWSIHHAAEAHNHGREQQAERQPHEAEKSRRNRLVYGIIAIVAAGGITFGMIERGLTALAGGSLIVTVVMIALAAITGLLLPVLTYWGKALDGSKVSRERDAMVEDLDDDLDEHVDLSAEIEELFAKSEALDEIVVTDKLPRIRDEVQSQVNGAREDYLFLLVQLGLDAELPPPASMKVEPGVSGPIGTISTGIPGASAVDMQPVWDRMARLQGLRQEGEELRARRDALPPHPWDHSRVV